MVFDSEVPVKLTSLPPEIKASILEFVADADLSSLSMIWPGLLPLIRHRTFNTVVISDPRFDRRANNRDLIHKSIQNFCDLIASTPSIAESIRVLHLRENSASSFPQFVLIQHASFSQLVSHIPMMTRLCSLTLESMALWSMAEPDIILRTLKCLAPGQLKTLKLRNCGMNLTELVEILRAVVDLDILELRGLEISPASYNSDMVNFDLPQPWIHEDALVDSGFLSVDLMSLSCTSMGVDYFVDLLCSAKYSPLCDLRVLEISHLSGDSNSVSRINRLLAKSWKFLDELRLNGRGPHSTFVDYLVSSSLNIDNISRISLGNVLKLKEQHLNQWTLESPSLLALYTNSINRVTEWPTKLHHVTVNITAELRWMQKPTFSGGNPFVELDKVLSLASLAAKIDMLHLNISLTGVSGGWKPVNLREDFLLEFEIMFLDFCFPFVRDAYFFTDDPKGFIEVSSGST